MPLLSESLIHLTSLSSTSAWSPVTPFKHLAEPATGLETILSTKSSFCLNRVKMHVLEIPYFFRMSSALKPGFFEASIISNFWSLVSLFLVGVSILLHFTSLHNHLSLKTRLTKNPLEQQRQHIQTSACHKIFCLHFRMSATVMGSGRCVVGLVISLWGDFSKSYWKSPKSKPFFTIKWMIFFTFELRKRCAKSK